MLKDPDFGEILGDGEQPLVGRHVFAMVQSLRNEAVEELDPDAYEVVVIDEVHHAAAAQLPRAARAPPANGAAWPDCDAGADGR